MVSHLVMCDGFWSSSIGDMYFLICHMTAQNHVIEGSCNFMSGYVIV